MEIFGTLLHLDILSLNDDFKRSVSLKSACGCALAKSDCNPCDHCAARPKAKKRSVFAASVTGWRGLGNEVNRPHNAGILRGMQMSVARCQQNPVMQPVAEWASNTKVADGLWGL